MCRVLHLSESGYYRWLRNRGRHSSRQLLAGKVKKILEEHPDNRNYGVDRVCLALEQDGVDVSRRTVYRVMKENGWLHKRRIPHGITKTTTEAQEQENILKRDFSAQRPSEKFLTDITEVQCADGKLYVSPIMDCFSGEIVALEMRDNRKKELCIDTVRQLERLYPSLSGAVFHSDRGSQYTSLAFRSELSRCGMIQSLSGTGHCFDNARMESFFATLKKEKIYQIAAYKLPREQVKTSIFAIVLSTTTALGSIRATRWDCRLRSTGSGCRRKRQPDPMPPQFSCVPLRSTSENCAVLPCFSDFGCFPTAHFLTFPELILVAILSMHHGCGDLAPF